MLNQNITSAKAILFLGAGGSQPLGFPTMESFMGILESDLDDREHVVLRNMYLRYTPPGESGRDLEIILENLRRYLTFFELAEGDPNFMELGILGTTDETAILREAIDGINAKILKLMFYHYGYQPDDTKLVGLYGPLFGMMDDLFQQPVLPVFTTNYDSAIEGYADAGRRSCEFGFQEGRMRRSWNPQLFHAFSPKFRRGTSELALFKLHGSVTWYEDGIGVKYVSEAQVRLRDMKNMVIYPGETKVGMLEEPYCTCYTYLKRCLENASNVVIVGYSCRDRILQRVFQEAIQDNPDLRFAVINGRGCEDTSEVLKEVLGQSLTLVAEDFEPGEEAPYLGKLRVALVPAPVATAKWVGRTHDLVGAGPGIWVPDGLPDAVFELRLEGGRDLMERIDLHRVDQFGNETGEHWTTVDDGITWPLGILRHGAKKLQQLPFPTSDPVLLVASDRFDGESWFGPGDSFRVDVAMKGRPLLAVHVQIPS